MDLLIIKSGEKYIRVKEDGYLLCGLDKASVFPFEKMEMVKDHVRCLKGQAFNDVALYKLVLHEEPLNE